MADIFEIPQQPQPGRLAQFLSYLESEKPEFLPSQLDVMGLVRRLAITNPMTAAREMPAKLAESRQMLEEYTPGGQVNDKLLNQFMNLIGFAPVGMTSSAGKSISQTLADEYYNMTTKANELYGQLRSGNVTPELLNEYKTVRARRDELYPQVFKEAAEQPQVTQGLLDDTYKGQHTAPMKDSGAPLWKLDNVYPSDFYSSQGARFYGDGAEPARDSRIVGMMQSFRERPDRSVTIYRAIPKNVDAKINTGDWVTLDRQYAKEHGESALNGEYKIVRKTVKARDLFTNGDSIYEFGYDPQPFVPKSKR